ncbi:MAG: ATP-binding protein [Eubacterium sp.]|nr:ATP-binding protein [Eubacterium sp.]
MRNAKHLKIPCNSGKRSHFVIIQILNPCAGNKGAYTEPPATSKRDAGFHGWGLLSVADAVKKNIFIIDLL